MVSVIFTLEETSPAAPCTSLSEDTDKLVTPFVPSLEFVTVDKVFEFSDPKTSSLDRDTLDESLSTFETLDTEISDESAVFSNGTEASDVSSTKLIAYESVTFTSLAHTALAVKITKSAKKAVSNNCFFKIIYLHNNFLKFQ